MKTRNKKRKNRARSKSQGPKNPSLNDEELTEGSTSCIVSGLIWVNSSLSLKFFFLLILGMQTDLLVGAFANLRFLNLNSTFGLLNLAVAATVLILLLALMISSFLKLKKINQHQLNAISCEGDPKLREWLFLKDGYELKNKGIWVYFQHWILIKETLSTFCILVFVENAYLQLVPLVIMSGATATIILTKAPYTRAIKNKFTFFSEIMYLVLYLGFLAIELTQNTLTFR